MEEMKVSSANATPLDVSMMKGVSEIEPWGIFEQTAWSYVKTMVEEEVWSLHDPRIVGTSQADAEKREIRIAEERPLFLPEPQGKEGDGAGNDREQQQPARLLHDFHQRRNGHSDGFFAPQAAEYAKHSADPRGMMAAGGWKRRISGWFRCWNTRIRRWWIV